MNSQQAMNTIYSALRQLPATAEQHEQLKSCVDVVIQALNAKEEGNGLDTGARLSAIGSDSDD